MITNDGGPSGPGPDQGAASGAGPRAHPDGVDGSADRGRRSLLKLMTGVLAGAIGAVVAVPAALLVGAPLRRRIVRGGDAPIEVARLESLPDGVPVAVRVAAEAVNDAWVRFNDVGLGTAWLVRRGGGVTAFTASCPHAGCYVDWDKKASRFACPCHESVFAIDGRVVGGPSPRPLDALEVEVKGGNVLVRFQRFRPARPDKEVA